MAYMSQRLKQLLTSDAISPEVAGAIEAAMMNAPSASHEAGAYAREMETAFDSYGLEGVKTQIMYMLCNLRNWRGEDARHTKEVLRKFTQKKRK